MDSFLKTFKIQLFSKVLYVGMSLCARLKTGICDIYFTQNLFIFYVNSIWYDRLIIAETIIWLCSYVKEKYVLYFKTLFCYWATFKWSEKQIFAKLFQCCFLNVKATPMNKLNFHFQPNIKVETALIYRRWINVILSMLFQRCFINVETTSINIRRLNFHFQPSFNVETTLFYWSWIDVILSTLFQRYFANFETKSINVRRLNFYFQPNMNVETTLMNDDDQRCFNV